MDSGIRRSVPGKVKPRLLDRRNDSIHGGDHIFAHSIAHCAWPIIVGRHIKVPKSIVVEAGCQSRELDAGTAAAEAREQCCGVGYYENRIYIGIKYLNASRVKNERRSTLSTVRPVFRLPNK
jgi:hypothetical protein